LDRYDYRRLNVLLVVYIELLLKEARDEDDTKTKYKEEFEKLYKKFMKAREDSSSVREKIRNECSKDFKFIISDEEINEIFNKCIDDIDKSLGEME